MGATELLLLFLLVTVPFGLLVFALFDSSKYADATWETAGQNRMFWTVGILLVGCIGPLVYLTIARPKLREVEPDAAAVDLDPGNDRFS